MKFRLYCTILMIAFFFAHGNAKVTGGNWNFTPEASKNQASPSALDASAASEFFANFTITASSGSGGSISPTGSVIVASGANQTFTLTPNTGRHVDSLIVDGVNQGQITTYTFVNVIANHTIRAVFAINQYIITATAGPHGNISPNGAVNVNFGNSKTFTITPAAAYHVDSVIVDGVDQGQITTYTFTNVTANHTINAVFAINQYTITATTGANGSISPGGAVIVNSGANQLFTITPNTGYHVDSLYADGANQGQLTSYTFTNVTANHTINAVFAINQYTITASAGNHGTISPIGAVIVNYGANQLFTVTPDTGYHVDSLFIDNIYQGQQTSYTFTNVTSNRKIKATFAINQYTLTASTGVHGSISPNGTVVVNYGVNQTFTVTPDTGYYIDTLYVDGVNQGQLATYKFTNVTANHTISAVFAIYQFTITASAGNHGTISPPGAVVVDYGTNQSFTVTPDTGYHVDSLYIDGTYQGQQTSYTFTNITANHKIKGTFAINQYTLTATAGVHGSISPSGTWVVNYGVNQTFTITPDTGYYVDTLYVDGVSQGQLASYKFTNVTANHTISAVFAINQFTITASEGPHGSINPLGVVIVNYGTDQTFTVVPDTGYHVDSLYVDGAYQGQQTTYTFTDVTANHKIKATFAINVYTITSSSGAHGSISPNGTLFLNSGVNQTYTVTPDTGYYIDSLYVDGVNQGQLASYKFTNVTANHTINAVFAIYQFTITANAGSHGSISPAGVVNVNYGANQTFDITPDTGYHVDSVYIDGVYQPALVEVTFTNVTADHKIKATFAIDTYTITASASTHGSISPGGTLVVNYGVNQNYTITPDIGYNVASVIVDGVDEGQLSSYKFTNVTANHTISVLFAINQYTITATSGPHGSINPVGVVNVDYGSNQSFTVTPDTGYHIDSLYIDGAYLGQQSSYTFSNVTANHKIKATFSIDLFTITASAGTHGTISPSGTVIVNYGTNQQFNVTPDSGYHVDSLFVDGVDQGQPASYKFTNVTSSHTIRVVFAVTQFTITASSGPHGIINPSGTIGKSFGQNQLFTMIPDTGYHVDSLYVDGVYQGQQTSYTFANVTANHKIKGTFAINLYTIVASAGAHGSISPSGSLVVSFGTNQTYSVTPDTGYYIDSLLVDGANQGRVNSYKLKNISADHTIRAVFAQIRSTMTVGIAIDVNGNGIQDAEDVAPLPSGVAAKIILTKDGSPYDSTTVGDGLVSTVTFFISVPGKYKAQEQGLPAGWIKTLGGLDSALVGGSNIQDTATFLNFKLVTMQGTVYNDRNKNGLIDGGESGLEGWEIQANGAGGKMKSTDENGAYVISNLGPGTHTITEAMISNWSQTSPAGGSYTFNAVSGQDIAGFDFGNYDTRIVSSTISGMVFADIAKDSVKNPPDFGLRNWKVVLHGVSSPSFVDTVKTDSMGFYVFGPLAGGNYVVSEVTKARSVQTYPPSNSYAVTVDALGTPVVDRDFGNFRHVTADTARAVVMSDVIGVRPDSIGAKAFQFHIPLPAQMPLPSPMTTITSAGDSLPVGTVVYSWDSSVVYNVTRPQYFYWIDLQGGLKFGHRTLFVFVDQAAEAETVAAQWWPVVQLPDQNPLEVWSSWDNRVSSSDLFYGGYGQGNTPIARYKSILVNPHLPASAMSRTALSGRAALLLGGKAESSTEQATWQHDLDSVRASLISGNPPAVDPGNVLVMNNATGDDVNALLQQVANCDTLYLYFTGHGGSSANGSIVLNHLVGSATRELLTYAGLSNTLFNSMNLKRLNMLIDASNSGKAIDYFMQSKKPVVNLVTSTDGISAAGAGLPNDTASTYTKVWRQTMRTVPLSPAVRLNWRKLNATVRTNNLNLTAAQNPVDTTNAAAFVSNTNDVQFPDVNVGDSSLANISVSNFGFIPLNIDSIQISDPEFSVAGSHSGTIIRNSNQTFTLVFTPTSGGNKSATVTFFHNAEISTADISATGRGLERYIPPTYRTFLQDSLAMKGVKKKAYGAKFCADFPNNTQSTQDGLLIKFDTPVSITFAQRFTNPPMSFDGGVGKLWLFSGATVPTGTLESICGVGHKGRPVRVDAYYWIFSNSAAPPVKRVLSPSVPPGQQLLLPMPNAGNIRDTVFQSCDFSTNGFVIGVPVAPPQNLQYGWIRIKKCGYLAKYFYDRGLRQTGDAQPFALVGNHTFTKEWVNLTPRKYSNHLAGELAALHFSIRASALGRTPVGLGELIYDDSTSNPLNGLMIKTIADSADRMLTFRWGPASYYKLFDTVISRINRAFSGPIDTVSFSSQLVLKGVRTAGAVGYVRPSNIPPTRIQSLYQKPIVPEEMTLYQNYPNPFNPTTTIEFDLLEPSFVTLKVYNILGQQVATLFDHQAMDDGNQETDFSGESLPSGVYFYRLEVSTIPDDPATASLTRTSVKKMLLIK